MLSKLYVVGGITVADGVLVGVASGEGLVVGILVAKGLAGVTPGKQG